MDDETHQQWRRETKQRSEEIRAAVVARLRVLREEKALSNRQLSISSGLSRGTIRNIESGLQSPALETLIMLAEGLGVDLSQIIQEELGKAPRVILPVND